MRSEEEIEKMANELTKVTNDSPENYRGDVYKECVYWLTSLLWVLEEVDTEEVMRELLLKKDKKELNTMKKAEKM